MQTGAEQQHLVIIGAGMAGSKLAAELLAQPQANFRVTLIGEESRVGYNRIMLSSLLAKEIDVAQMALVDTQQMRVNGAQIIAGDPVVSIQPQAKQLSLQSGQTLHYDKLVLATGSRARLLPIAGADAPNVMGFRNWQDVEQMSSLQGSQVISVIGGGLLGLEAAVGLVKRGHKVTLFHRGAWLLNRQLDEESAQLLQIKLEKMGVVFRLGESPQALQQDALGRVSHCLLEHESYETDLVIMAAGITPEVSLAKQAGLQCQQAIVVNAQMQTSQADIYALGECCEFEQQTFGLVAPIWTQIDVLISVLAGQQAAFSIAPTPTKLKVSGVDLFSVGKIQATHNDHCLYFKDLAGHHYRKLVVNEGLLVGAILYGNVADGSWYFQLIQNKTNVSDMLDLLVFGEAYCRPKIA